MRIEANIQNTLFYPNPDVIVSQDHNVSKAHEELNHIDIKGIIGVEIFEKSIWAIPCKIHSKKPLYFLKFTKEKGKSSY